MDKQILFNIIHKNDGIEISQSELQLFDEKFKSIYKLIRLMRTKDMQINETNLITIANLTNTTIDTSVIIDNPLLVNNSQELKDLYIKERKFKLENDFVKDKLENFEKTGNVDEIKEALKVLDTKIKTQKEDDLLEPISVVKQKQVEFLERVIKKIPQDGLYLSRFGGSTQFKNLAEYLRIIERTDFIVIAGRPAVGKTAFSLAITNALLKNGYRGAYFSLEMPNEQLLNRLAIAKSGIPSDTLFRSDIEIDSTVTHNYLSALEHFSSQPLYITEKLPKSWKDIEASILKMKDKLDFVVIDYLGLISSYDGKDYGQPKHVVISNISRDMKLFAREHKIALIVLQQITRDVGGEQRGDKSYAEPYMHNLRDSGSVEQDVDKAIMLYKRKPEKHEEALESLGRVMVMCKVEKNRAGKIGKIPMIFNGSLQRFEEAK